MLQTRIQGEASQVAEAVRTETRSLRDLRGVGASIERDLKSLGVSSVVALAGWTGDDLYTKLCQLTAARQDPCVLDTFRCAVAQARDRHLPSEQCNWWWWSRLRKGDEASL